MKYSRILVPFDGSDHAQGAFTTARSLALSSEETEIFVVNVVPMALASSLTAAGTFSSDDGLFFDQPNYTAMIDEALKNIEREMDDVIGPLLDGMPANRVHIEAATYPSAVSGLVDYAKAHNCDLIVMGRRGIGGLRGVLGSVSYGVLRSVNVPVLTVK